MDRVKAQTLYLFLFLVSLYILSISTAWSNRDIGEGHVRIAVLNSLVDNGSIGLRSQLPHTVPGRDGKYYNVHEFGQNIFVIPVFLILEDFRDTGYPFFIVNAILTALSCVLIREILIIAGFSPTSSMVTALLYGIATSAWFYGAKAPFEQPVAVFLILAAFFYYLRFHKGIGHSLTNLIIGAACFGTGFITRYDTILSLPALFILVLHPKKDYDEQGRGYYFKILLVTTATLLPFIIFGIYYNNQRFGSIWESGQHLYTNKILFSIYYLPLGLTGFLVSPGKSIFLYNPLLLLLPFAVRKFYRKTNKSFFLSLCIQLMVYIFFYSSYFAWHGDWCWGPRYLLIITPFLVMPLTALIEEWKSIDFKFKVAITSVIAVSTFVQLLPIISNFYISLAMKYGFNIPEHPQLQRNFGSLGSVTHWKSFFILRYTSIVAQISILKDTLFCYFIPGYFLRLSKKILFSEWPQVFLVRDLYEIDLWWVQLKSVPARVAAVFLFTLNCLSGWKISCGLSREQI